MMMMPSCQYAYCSHGWPAICHVVLHRSCVTMLPNERYTWRTVHKHSHTLYAVRLARWENEWASGSNADTNIRLIIIIIITIMDVHRVVRRDEVMSSYGSPWR